jgi:hypothetical protein
MGDIPSCGAISDESANASQVGAIRPSSVHAGGEWSLRHRPDGRLRGRWRTVRRIGTSCKSPAGRVRIRLLGMVRLRSLA